MTHALPTRRSSGRADVRDGACSSSTLQEAASWGNVSTAMEQMVFAEAGSVIPLLASDAYHRGHWKTRAKRAYATMFDRACSASRSEERRVGKECVSKCRSRLSQYH